ncbi:hypothetical protein AK812_SmicGene17570 [Symbiodinium microadriaticum]|uniref:Uncharacterized protein n=1 Tax=Symbiodinium microadriaticum TaxID=2951 RepID=A0A1Q9DXB1_SYMMI|nr:hypothetical protein AK812_SmicGene17570 [Symbiodinium microadriaticum]CAE7236243.1 unnamed protein product [Symbiodinium sp. KB8]CAE7581940.1 unnamed protein product [Symbiodinium microadriaticum]
MAAVLRSSLQRLRKSRATATSRGCAAMAREKTKKTEARSPLLEFQLDAREVKHMAPHVLASAIASAGAGRHTSPTLWRAYAARASEVRRRLTLRDLRRLFQGHAAAGKKDISLFRDLLDDASWKGDPQASARDLCFVAIALAKLRCNNDIFEAVTTHFAENTMDDLESIDVSSLANAFSRVALTHKVCWAKISQRLRADASSALLPPAAATMALNAFAVVKQCDSELFMSVVESSIRPCIADYTITQAALLLDALARCSSGSVTAQLAPDLFRSFKRLWLSQGHLQELAGPEDLAHLASSAVKLGIVQEEQFNLALASAGLQHVGQFSPSQLALFCSNLARLPSAGRAAFLAVAALQVQRTLRFSSFVDLGLLSQAFGSSSITLTREASELYLQRLSVVSKEELANLAQGPGSGSDLVNSLAAALERVAEGSLQLLSPSVDGELLLASIRPLTLELCARRAVRPRTAAAVLDQHAHFCVRDQELFEALEDEEHSSSDISATLAGRLLRPLGALGHPSEHFLQSVDKSLSIWGKRLSATIQSDSGVPNVVFEPWTRSTRSLPALAADLFAAALLDFAFLSEVSVTYLFSAAKTQCQLNLPADSALRMKCAGEIAAASQVWLQHVAGHPEACWLADWAEEVFSTGGPQHNLAPQPSSALLRSVFAALQRAQEPGDKILVAWPMHGFRADLALRRPGARTMAIEVCSKECFHSGSQRLLARSAMKHRVLTAALGAPPVQTFLTKVVWKKEERTRPSPCKSSQDRPLRKPDTLRHIAFFVYSTINRKPTDELYTALLPGTRETATKARRLLSPCRLVYRTINELYYRELAKETFHNQPNDEDKYTAGEAHEAEPQHKSAAPRPQSHQQPEMEHQQRPGRPAPSNDFHTSRQARQGILLGRKQDPARQHYDGRGDKTSAADQEPPPSGLYPHFDVFNQDDITQFLLHTEPQYQFAEGQPSNEGNGDDAEARQGAPPLETLSYNDANHLGTIQPRPISVPYDQTTVYDDDKVSYWDWPWQQDDQVKFLRSRCESVWSQGTKDCKDKHLLLKP